MSPKMVGKVKICSTVRHEGEVTCLLYDQVLFSGSEDGTVRIWDSDLHAKRELNAHAALIYAMATDAKGRLFTSSTDGLIKNFENPRSSDFSQELCKSFDELMCLVCVGDDIYSGDDKGNVVWYVNGKEKLTYNVVEEIKSLAVENDLIYTIRDNDCVISERVNHTTDTLVTKATIPGRFPLILCGKKPKETHEYLVFCTRDGKGLVQVDNLRPEGQKMASFKEIWSKDNCHEMIINTLFGNDKFVYSGGFDGKVKKWEISSNHLELLGEVDVGCCVNAIVDGPNGSIYVGGADGAVREIVFE